MTYQSSSPDQPSDEKQDLLKIKLKEEQFSEGDLEIIARALKKQLKQKFQGADIKEDVRPPNKVKFKVKPADAEEAGTVVPLGIFS